MSVSEYAGLRHHVGHVIECVTYGPNGENVALECLTCDEVLLDYDKNEDDANESN